MKSPDRHLKVQGAKVIALGSYMGLDGGNAFLDFDDLPFVPRRLYTVYRVGQNVTRGNHAHGKYSQLYIASAGSCRLLLDNAISQDEVVLSLPSEGLLVPPLVWTVAADFTPGAALTVLSSGPFDPGEVIKSKDELRRLSLGTQP
jgi:hypothetical protein